LVAEDNPVNQTVISMMLEKLGYAADIVASGREAVEALARAPYALVLMDCHMPDMDGLEATRAIRAAETVGARQGASGNETERSSAIHHLSPLAPRRIPIIALTASAMQEDRDLCAAAGMDDFVTKPIRIELLDEVLSRWIPDQRVKVDDVASVS
jgi:CheY-like chemotaxis protein